MMGDVITAERQMAARGLDPEVQRTLTSACNALFASQEADGHWVFELEADATIPSEYVLLRHYRGEPVDAALERKIAAYLRRIQGAHGGWPLFHGGPFDTSASVKAYFALKMIGDSPDADHMRAARSAILSRGGAANCNVFTRMLLALYGFLDWRAGPYMPVEIMLLPRWAPFHISKISYWARTVLVPLLVLQTLKPRAKNPRGVTIDELFLQPPKKILAAAKPEHQRWRWFLLFRSLDAVLRRLAPFSLQRWRRRAIEKASAFVIERLNGDDGLGAIFPAMANATMMFDALGGPANQARARIARQSVERLLVIGPDEAYCQPCVSPVWDTALACHALLEVGTSEANARATKALEWLAHRQVLDIAGDWALKRPDVPPGGWAFQYSNPHYPDLDDTAVVVMAMDRARRLNGGNAFDIPIRRGAEWIKGMQSSNGGWAAFDVDNTYDYLNNIPFADHGALIDPPTEDVTARCVSMLAQLGETTARCEALARGIKYLRARQTADGSWYGRWGMNYIYGTWSVLCALSVAGVAPHAPEIRKAATWLVSIQNPDGGWGEDGSSYRLDYRGHVPAPSTASQTAWALLGLMAAGDVDHPVVERGIRFLLRTQQEDGLWSEAEFTATGFPRVFYLRYHGYRKYFPLWALARFLNLKVRGQRTVAYGM